MPNGWGLRITLETSEGETLTEYGTSSLRTRLAEQDRIVTTKVEAKTDKKFYFRIEGRGPFLNFASKDVRPPPTIFRSPPYALSMKVLIDGKELNGSLLVDLLPQYPVMAEGRVVKCWNLPARVNESGEELYRPHNWVFTDVGIEVQLAQLDLMDVTGGVGEDMDDAVSGGQVNGTARQNSKKGTIEVRLDRFIVHGRGLTSRPQDLVKPPATKSEAGMAESRSLQPPVTMAASGPSEKSSHESADHGIGPNVTHQVELVAEGQEERRWPTAKGFYPDFVPYATFQWQYMSRSKLIKLGLSNEDGSKVTTAQKAARQHQEERAASIRTRGETLKRKASEQQGELVASNRQLGEASKRKATEDAKNTDVIMESTRSEAEGNNTQLAAGRQLVIPLRPKSNTERHWLRSSQQKPAAIEASKDADEEEGGDISMVN